MGLKNEGEKHLVKYAWGFAKPIKFKKNSLKQLMNPSQALPASPGRVDAWLFVWLFQAASS